MLFLALLTKLGVFVDISENVLFPTVSVWLVVHDCGQIDANVLNVNCDI